MQIKTYQFQSSSENEFLGLSEQLRNGIWPRSVPLWMAAFYVALFIIRPWDQLFPWLGEIHFERIYALCMLSAVFLSKEKRWEMNFQTLTVLLFLGGIGLSYLFAVNPSLAWEPFYEYLTLIIFYFVLLLVIRTPHELIFMVICYIVTMAVYLAKSQWEFFVHGQHRYDMGVVRMTGIESAFGGPNSLAMSIVVSLPIAVFLWSSRKEVCLGWPDFWQKWYPYFIVAYFLLALSSIVLTNSRSGAVSFVLFILITGLKGKRLGRKMGYVLAGMFLVALIWQVIPEENKGRFRTIWAPETGPENAQVSAEGRIEGYKAGMTMFDRFPITGVGIGNFVSYRVRNVDGVPLEAHNLVGQVLGETGIIGGMTFLLMVITILVNCRKVRVLSEGHSDLTLRVLSGLGVAFRNSLLLLVFTGLFGHNLLRFNWLWLAAFSTLALQFTRKTSEEKDL